MKLLEDEVILGVKRCIAEADDLRANRVTWVLDRI